MVVNRKDKTDPLVLLGKKLLARYTIQDRIAQGGMSVIYRGYDERLQRPVCVKVFFGLEGSSVAHLTGYEHFVQEAFALSQLRHPNTIHIYDFGYLEVEPRSPFHISELMEGGTLRTYLEKSGALSLETTIEILEPIVGALSEAHSRNIVHRDIKPANILVGMAGSRRIFKLADFGIAKALVDEQNRAIPNRAHETRAIDGRRISLYSPGWAAPEQLRGRPVGPSSDVFALGLVVVFMLTAKKLFSDDEFKRVLERAEGDEYLERAIDGTQLPPPIVQVIKKACRVAAGERYPTVEALLLDLKRAVRRLGRAHKGAQAAVSARSSEGGSSSFLTGSATPIAADGITHIEAMELGSDAQVPPVSGRIEDGRALPTIMKWGSRQVHLLSTDYQLDVESTEEHAASPTRLKFRITFLPDRQGKAHLHLKGLNCFVAKAGARVTNALDMTVDTELEVFLPDRKDTQKVSCRFGASQDDSQIFGEGNDTFKVPLHGVTRAVLLDFGPSRDPMLVCRRINQLVRGVAT